MKDQNCCVSRTLEYTYIERLYLVYLLHYSLSSKKFSPMLLITEQRFPRTLQQAPLPEKLKKRLNWFLNNKEISSSPSVGPGDFCSHTTDLPITCCLKCHISFSYRLWGFCTCVLSAFQFFLESWEAGQCCKSLLVERMFMRNMCFGIFFQS